MPPVRNILFVCEHGAAKSILAAAGFNRLAEERNLPYRATSRAVDPEPEVRPKVQGALVSQGILPWPDCPRALDPSDLEKAFLVVTFDQPGLRLPGYNGKAVIEWNGLPAVSEDLASAQAAIQQRLESLLGDLAR